MADTPFVAAGWSQHHVERESQGEEDDAGHLRFRSPERHEDDARNVFQRPHRDPNLAHDRLQNATSAAKRFETT
jgi:hypothetical protein